MVWKGFILLVYTEDPRLGSINWVFKFHCNYFAVINRTNSICGIPAGFLHKVHTSSNLAYKTWLGTIWPEYGNIFSKILKKQKTTPNQQQQQQQKTKPNPPHPPLMKTKQNKTNIQTKKKSQHFLSNRKKKKKKEFFCMEEYLLRSWILSFIGFVSRKTGLVQERSSATVKCFKSFNSYNLMT